MDSPDHSIQNYLGDVDADDIRELENSGFAIEAFNALNTIMGTNPFAFQVRLAALKCFISDSRGYIPTGDLRSLWHWMNDATFNTTQTVLGQGGWIDHDPQQGWHLTDLGHRYHQVLFFLQKQSQDDNLADSLHMMDALNAMDLGENASLHSIKAQLKQVLINVEQASKVFSSILLERFENEAQKAIDIGNEVVKRAEKYVNVPSKRPLIQGLHRALSELGKAQATLSRNRLQVLDQGISLPNGVKIKDVTKCLMDLDADVLAAPVARALRPSCAPGVHIDTEAVIYGAQEYLGQVRLQDLKDLPPAEEAEDLDAATVATNPATQRFLAKLNSLPEDESEWRIVDIVDDEQQAMTLFHIALSTLVGSQRNQYRPGTLMRQFSELPLEFIPGEEVIDVDGRSLKRVSNAVIRRRNVQ